MKWTQMGKRLLRRLACDEQGAEVVETALVLGLLVLVALGVMAHVGQGVLLKWRAVFDDL